MNKEQIEKAAEQYAEELLSVWTNDYNGFIAGAEFVLQNLPQAHVSLSLPPSEADIKDALLIGYVAGHSSQSDIEENVFWNNYKKYCLKLNKVPDDDGGNASVGSQSEASPEACLIKVKEVVVEPTIVGVLYSDNGVNKDYYMCHEQFVRTCLRSINEAKNCQESQ